MHHIFETWLCHKHAVASHRNMRGDEARKLCADAGSELQLVQVPTAHGKADLTAYRAAGKQARRKDSFHVHAHKSFTCLKPGFPDMRL